MCVPERPHTWSLCVCVLCSHCGNPRNWRTAAFKDKWLRYMTPASAAGPVARAAQRRRRRTLVGRLMDAGRRLKNKVVGKVKNFFRR